MLNKKLTLSWPAFYSIIVGLLPVIILYKGLFADIGTMMLILLSPLVLLYSLKLGYHKKRNLTTYHFLIVLLIDAVCSVMFWGEYSSNGYHQALLAVLVMSFCVAVHTLSPVIGLFDWRVGYKTVQIVSVINAILIMFQYICHYMFKTYFNMVFTNLLINDAKGYLNYLTTGYADGMFRPAGIFLEPAHFTLYALVALVTILTVQDGNKKKYGISIVITVSLWMTTSGIGIVLSLATWAAYLVQTDRINLRAIKKVLIGIVAAVIALIVAYKFDFFRSAISRVFTSDIGQSAITGRTYNYRYLSPEFLSNIVLGNGFMNVPPSYYTYNPGFIRLIYGQGYFGCAIFFIMWLTAFLKSNYSGKILALFFCIMMAVSQIYSTIYMTFLLVFLFSCQIHKSQYGGEDAELLKGLKYVRKN